MKHSNGFWGFLGYYMSCRCAPKLELDEEYNMFLFEDEIRWAREVSVHALSVLHDCTLV